MYWLTYRHTVMVVVVVSMVSMCGFTARMYVLVSGWEFGVPVVNLCASLRAVGPQIHPSMCPFKLTGLHLWRIPACAVLSTHH